MLVLVRPRYLSARICCSVAFFALTHLCSRAPFCILGLRAFAAPLGCGLRRRGGAACWDLAHSGQVNRQPLGNRTPRWSWFHRDGMGRAGSRQGLGGWKMVTEAPGLGVPGRSPFLGLNIAGFSLNRLNAPRRSVSLVNTGPVMALPSGKW